MHSPLAGHHARPTAAGASARRAAAASSSASSCISATAAGTPCPSARATSAAEPEDAGVEARVLPSHASAGAGRQRKQQ